MSKMIIIVGRYYPKIIKNENLYEITKVEPWSRTIKRRRLKWLGHLMRLSDDTPAKLSLKEHLRPVKNKVGRPKTTWFKTIINDIEPIIQLNPKNREHTLEILERFSHNRKEWDSVVQTLLQ